MIVTKAVAWTIGMGAASMIAASVLAQDVQGQRRQANKPVIGNMQGGANSADAQLAACLISANQDEIALGKLAEQKAKDSDVKQFGERMVHDHTQFMQQLEKFANRGEGQATAQNQNMASVNSAQTQPMGSEALNYVALNQEVSQKCLDMVRKRLESKEGSQFDKAYIGQQIGEHMLVLGTLEVFRNHASPELAGVMDKGIETTKSHLDEAEKVAKSLEKD
jgi:putative membrane protein